MGGEPFDGLGEVSLEPGIVRRLPAGFDIKFSSPQQAQQTAEFVGHQIRAIAAGLCRRISWTGTFDRPTIPASAPG
jgi:capsid protein